MRRQEMLRDCSVFPAVDGGVGIALTVGLEGNSHGIRSAAVDEVRQRHNPFIAYALIRIERYHPCQVGTLMPELRTLAELAEQMVAHRGRLKLRSRRPDSELGFRNMPRQDS